MWDSHLCERGRYVGFVPASSIFPQFTALATHIGLLVSYAPTNVSSDPDKDSFYSELELYTGRPVSYTHLTLPTNREV